MTVDIAALTAHVWQVKIDDMQAQRSVLFSLLDADERDRAIRFRFERDRVAYVTMRGMLRVLLGHYLNQDCRKLRFGYNAFGKPYLDAPLAFNVSRTRSAGLLAFATEEEIGVDIERLRPEIVTDDLARQVLSAAEMNDYTASSERSQLFFEVWTRKEAYVKAVGTGLSTPLPSITVLGRSTVDQHSIYQLTADMPEHLAALAVKGSVSRIMQYSGAQCPLP
jgi:4'-phosphopantetheinyl transferase